jgi:hypothetical protein
MKQALLVGALVAALGLPAAVSAQTAGTSLGSVTLSKKVMANGQPLPPGTYQVRLTEDVPPQPAAGETPGAERYVEFVRGGKVVGREVATLVAQADVNQIAKGEKPPAPGGSRVELLKGNVYLRVWLNRGGTHYFIHLPTT